MSSIGVHSNVYQRVRHYGQLVDDVLLGLRSGSTAATDASRRKLGELLAGVATSPPPDLRTAWLGMLIGGSEQASRAEWARLGKALLSTNVEPNAIDRLEDLARRLEDRRTDALAKMRGVRM